MCLCALGMDAFARVLKKARKEGMKVFGHRCVASDYCCTQVCLRVKQLQEERRRGCGYAPHCLNTDVEGYSNRLTNLLTNLNGSKSTDGYVL
jgi:hypothetical protein